MRLCPPPERDASLPEASPYSTGRRVFRIWGSVLQLAQGSGSRANRIANCSETRGLRELYYLGAIAAVLVVTALVSIAWGAEAYVTAAAVVFVLFVGACTVGGR